MDALAPEIILMFEAWMPLTGGLTQTAVSSWECFVTPWCSPIATLLGRSRLWKLGVIALAAVPRMLQLLGYFSGNHRLRQAAEFIAFGEFVLVQFLAWGESLFDQPYQLAVITLALFIIISDMVPSSTDGDDGDDAESSDSDSETTGEIVFFQNRQIFVGTFTHPESGNKRIDITVALEGNRGEFRFLGQVTKIKVTREGDTMIMEENPGPTSIKGKMLDSANFTGTIVRSGIKGGDGDVRLQKAEDTDGDSSTIRKHHTRTVRHFSTLSPSRVITFGSVLILFVVACTVRRFVYGSKQVSGAPDFFEAEVLSCAHELWGATVDAPSSMMCVLCDDQQTDWSARFKPFGPTGMVGMLAMSAARMCMTVW
jgi:hypothetical protein